MLLNELYDDELVELQIIKRLKHTVQQISGYNNKELPTNYPSNKQNNLPENINVAQKSHIKQNSFQK